MDIGWPEILLASLIFAAACGVVATRRNRNGRLWAALGFVLWFIALFAVALLPSAQRQTPAV